MQTTVASSVVARVRQTTARYPTLAAVVTDETQLSYADLGRQIEEWRDQWVTLDTPAHSLVGIAASGQVTMPAAFLGALDAGLVPMLIDARQPATHRAEVIARAHLAAVVDLAVGEIVPTGDPDARVLSAEAGYVVFSSGSQGPPKGIVGQADGLIHFVDWEIETLAAGPGTRVAMLTAPSFDVVLRDLLLPLLSGGELHIPPNLVRSAPRAVLPWLAERRVSVLHAVPSLSGRWMAAAGVPLEHLQWTLFAGEPLYGQHVTRWRSVAPRSRVINLYGPSETTLAKFWYEVPADVGSHLLPVGRPLPGVRLGLEPTGVGTGTNERRVVITTAHGSLGYLPDTCGPADLARLNRADAITHFQTQDRGRLDENRNLVIAGRLDTLVKRRGVFVDLAAIESAAAALPYVRSAYCTQVTPSGRIVLTVEGPAQDAMSRLLRDIRSRVGELPDSVVAVETMPLMNGGKIDRAGIQALLKAEASDG